MFIEKWLSGNEASCVSAGLGQLGEGQAVDLGLSCTQMEDRK